MLCSGGDPCMLLLGPFAGCVFLATALRGMAFGMVIERMGTLWQMSLEGARVAQEQPSVGYPNIAFGVEDFEEAFKSLVRACSHTTLNPKP